MKYDEIIINRSASHAVELIYRLNGINVKMHKIYVDTFFFSSPIIRHYKKNKIGWLVRIENGTYVSTGTIT